jgi:hypothetical protein
LEVVHKGIIFVHTFWPTDQIAKFQCGKRGHKPAGVEEERGLRINLEHKELRAQVVIMEHSRTPEHSQKYPLGLILHNTRT